jgi:hypothetical protein
MPIVRLPYHQMQQYLDQYSLAEQIEAAQHQIPQVDWEKYWHQFALAHGGEPVPYGDDRVLFEDGWTYANNDYSGPEYPPPSDPNELLQLQLEYWLGRLKGETEELKKLANLREEHRSAQSERSAPLIYRAQEFNAETAEWDDLVSEFPEQEIADRQQLLTDDIATVVRPAIERLRAELMPADSQRMQIPTRL